jgi:hypothetical protein
MLGLSLERVISSPDIERLKLQFRREKMKWFLAVLLISILFSSLWFNIFIQENLWEFSKEKVLTKEKIIKT